MLKVIFLFLGAEGPLDIGLVGAELVGNYVFIYQEWIEPLSANIFIKNDILREIYPLQINQVNIISGDSIRTLIFTENETYTSLSRIIESHVSLS